MEDWIQLIIQVGALGIVWWYLKELGPVLRENTQMLGRIKEVIDDLEDKE